MAHRRARILLCRTRQREPDLEDKEDKRQREPQQRGQRGHDDLPQASRRAAIVTESTLTPLDVGASSGAIVGWTRTL